MGAMVSSKRQAAAVVLARMALLALRTVLGVLAAQAALQAYLGLLSLAQAAAAAVLGTELAALVRRAAVTAACKAADGRPPLQTLVLAVVALGVTQALVVTAVLVS